MLEEIAEQPAALERTFAAESPRVTKFRRFAQRRKFRLIVLVARGTSDNAALFGRYLLELTTGIPVSLCAPSIHTLYRARLDLRGALVIGISQSGEGPDINLVLRRTRRQGAFTLAITNEPASTLARIADEVFLVRAGPQRSVAATKTYTGQLLVLYLLAWALGSRIALPEVARAAERVARALTLAPRVRELAARFRAMRKCAVVARGLNYANAFELALKLMETCYVSAQQFSAADFRHGPIALVEPDFPVFLFAPPGKTVLDMQALARRLRKLGAQTVAVTSPGVALPKSALDIRLPGVIPEIYTPIPYIVPGQLLAAELARVKGLDPDRPRSLRIITKTV